MNGWLVFYLFVGVIVGVMIWVRIVQRPRGWKLVVSVLTTTVLAFGVGILSSRTNLSWWTIGVFGVGIILGYFGTGPALGVFFGTYKRDWERKKSNKAS